MILFISIEGTVCIESIVLQKMRDNLLNIYHFLQFQLILNLFLFDGRTFGLYFNFKFIL